MSHFYSHGAHHHVSSSSLDAVHLKWDNSLKPHININSGEIIDFDLSDGGNNQFTAQSTVEDIAKFDFSLTDPATGLVHVNGAQPGDVLKIEFLELKTGDFGWTAIFPDFGLLSDEFTGPALKIWDLTSGKTARFNDHIEIPIRPFLGVVGVAREEAGEWSTIPPYETGGNIDTKYIVEGSTLYLPVKVPGALFSCGDGHAAQGDGEVCGTAIETTMKAKLRLTVIPAADMPYASQPSFEAPPVGKGREAENVLEDKGSYASLGIDADLRESSRKALRGLIGWLMATKGLKREEAYMLASVTADLRIAEAVDMPHYAVACQIPLGVFKE
jgi:acetamidase/formamidase